MRQEPEYETVWSGAKDRNGECPRLSGYEGGSTLGLTNNDVQLAHGELREIQVKLGERPYAPTRAWRWKRQEAA